MGRTVEVIPLRAQASHTLMGAGKSQKKSGFRFLVSTIRYRFFLFAGIFPYLLGQVIAFNANGGLNRYYFWLGFLGIFLVLSGVELFNEYFDAKAGGDRVFSPQAPGIPNYFFILGVFVFILAFFIGLYFTFQIGGPILVFSFLGFLGAYFYVGPPLRWAYRGLGEIVIALCYGPFMVLGSYYLQSAGFGLAPLIVSLICGLFIFSLAIINEIPDYIQDRLVGKKNIVVRLGKERAIKIVNLSLFFAFLLLGLGIWWKEIPGLSSIAFLIVPLVVNSIRKARANLETPKPFYAAIRTVIVAYLVIVSSLGISYLGRLWN